MCLQDSIDFLDLSDNAILSLSNLPRLTRLTSLNLANNPISQISPNIANQLPNLQTLVLSGTQVGWSGFVFRLHDIALTNLLLFTTLPTSLHVTFVLHSAAQRSSLPITPLWAEEARDPSPHINRHFATAQLPLLASTQPSLSSLARFH